MVNTGPWSDEEDELLIKMYEEGELKRNIAVVLNRRVSAIIVRLTKLKIKRPEKSRRRKSLGRKWPICASNLRFEGDEYIDDFIGNY